MVLICLNLCSQCSIFGMATGYELADREVGARVPVVSRNFSTSSTQSPIQLVPGSLSPEVKRPGSEADYSPPTSVEVKKMWIYASIPPYAFMA
jgi:hypothetical protein